MKPKQEGPDMLSRLSELLPWSDGEQEALKLISAQDPNWRTSPFGPSDEPGLRRNFRAVVAASGGEDAALSALRRNPAIMLFGERQVRRAGEVLTEALGRGRATEVILKNPGVLTIDPESLRDNIGAVAFFAEVIDVIVRNAEVARAAFTVVQLGVLLALGKALVDIVRLRLFAEALP